MKKLLTTLPVVILALCTSCQPALAHEATHWQTGEKMGWSYSKGCCDGDDCAMIPDDSVTKTNYGYEIVLTKASNHPALKNESDDFVFSFTIPYNNVHSPDMYPSPDGHWHFCFERYVASDFQELGGPVDGFAKYCFYYIGDFL